VVSIGVEEHRGITILKYYFVSVISGFYLLCGSLMKNEPFFHNAVSSGILFMPSAAGGNK
jgi:hypothetical protein